MDELIKGIREAFYASILYASGLPIPGVEPGSWIPFKGSFCISSGDPNWISEKEANEKNHNILSITDQLNAEKDGIVFCGKHPELSPRKECICTTTDLMRYGCRCGAFVRTE